MPAVLKLDALDALPRTPASDVKKLGWRGVMRAVGKRGKVVVTNHNQPEAVIVSAEEYAAILEALERVPARDPILDELRRRFDERLSSLRAPDAGQRLRNAMKSPVRLKGQVKAGSGF